MVGPALGFPIVSYVEDDVATYLTMWVYYLSPKPRRWKETVIHGFIVVPAEINSGWQLFRH